MKSNQAVLQSDIQTLAAGGKGAITSVGSRRIQMLRGLAIIAVVLIHNTPLGAAQVFVRPFLNFAVGLFLFLSGMLSTARDFNPKKRILKMMIPYIIWTLVYSAISSVREPLQIPLTFLWNLLTGRSSAVMYYAFVYCELALLIPLIDKLARSRLKYLGFLITPLEIILVRTIPLLTDWYDLNRYVGLVATVSCLGYFTFFYLGYLMGNGLVSVRRSPGLWGILLAVSLPLQMLEAYWQFSHGVVNCGTQMKLSAVLTSVLFAVLAYCFIHSDRPQSKGPLSRLLVLLGDHSFAIFFSHMAVMTLLAQIPLYSKIVFYPLNAAVAIAVDMLFILVGRKILGKYGKYLALY